MKYKVYQNSDYIIYTCQKCKCTAIVRMFPYSYREYNELCFPCYFREFSLINFNMVGFSGYKRKSSDKDRKNGDLWLYKYKKKGETEAHWHMLPDPSALLARLEANKKKNSKGKKKGKGNGKKRRKK